MNELLAFFLAVIESIRQTLPDHWLPFLLLVVLVIAVLNWMTPYDPNEETE